MQEIESAVRDLGGSAMQGIDHAVKGLNSVLWKERCRLLSAS